MSKNIMINLLNEIDNFPELTKNFGALSDEQKKLYIDSINKMKRDKLYKSPIHGEYHSEKVTLFCLLLGTKLGCSQRKLDMLMDAGRYHDCMRQTDCEDSTHGMASAYAIDKITTNDYTDEEMRALKAVIDYHSVDTEIYEFRDIALNYDMEDSQISKYELLATILRDADALDRKRFSDDSIAALKSEFLSLKESHSLIALSTEVNNAYLTRMFTDEEILDNKHLLHNRSRCFHSVGQNVFRLNSILDNGLLSYRKLCELDSSFRRNFDGGNSDRWISVVPTNIFTGEGAADEFLKHGIVLLFKPIDLYYPDDFVISSYARSYGLPFRKNGGYVDEQYAFDCIPADEIYSIMIDEKLAKKDLKNLDKYVYNSFTYDLFEGNVKSLLNKMGLSLEDDVCKDLVIELNKYKEIDDNMAQLDDVIRIRRQHEYAERLMPICSKINKIIGKFMHIYYTQLLERDVNDVITLKDAVEYELGISGFKYTKIVSEEPCYILIGKDQKVLHKNEEN